VIGKKHAVPAKRPAMAKVFAIFEAGGSGPEDPDGHGLRLAHNRTENVHAPASKK
jgi:hypothetical protein